MIILKKGNDTKHLSEESKLIEKLLTLGWAIEEKKKKIEQEEVKNGKSSKSSS